MDYNSISGATLFRALPEHERQQAMQDWHEFCTQGDDSHKMLWHKLMENTARHQRMRPLFLRRLPLCKCIALMLPHLPSLLDDTQWHELLNLYYSRHRERLTRILHDVAGIEADSTGIIPSDGRWRDALTQAKALGFSAAELMHAAHALPYLAGSDEQRTRYRHLVSAWLEVASASASEPQLPELPPAPADPLLTQTGIDDFTTLDEVIHQQIIATSLQESGALSEDKIADLLDELLHLSSRRIHHYFHTGFADYLLWQRKVQDAFATSTLDGIRKAWYLNGWLAACVRQEAQQDFKQAYDTFGHELEPFIGTSGFIGTALANHLFDYMASHQFHHEALQMLKAMLQAANDSFVIKGLHIGEQLWHWEGPDIALDYLTLVVQRMEQAPAAFDDDLLFRAKRCYGQVLQEMGRFAKALEYFESLTPTASQRAKLLADIALLRAGFRSLHEIRLQPSAEQRSSMMAALAKAANDAEQAITLLNNAANANYLLAVFAFFRFREHENAQDGEQAQHFARQAVVGMLLSRNRKYYESMGLLGTAQFIEVCTLVHRMNSADVANIHSKWRGIHELSMIPPDDLAFFLEGVSLLDSASLTDIALKLIECHPANTWHIFCRGDALPHLLRQSNEDVLRYLHTILRPDQNSEPGAEAYANASIILQAMPETPSHRLIEMGRDALDVMEHCAWRNSSSRADFDRYLLDKKHIPFWSEEDGLWARVHLARIMGNDARCAALMPELFYLYRDQQTHAAMQIIEQCAAWQMDPALIAQLQHALPNDAYNRHQRHDDDDSTPIRIVFIGGNEIQQRYDDDVKAWAASELPAVRLCFEHTGWTSNWNRELDTLLNRVEAADVVVLMCMMRTTLGRHLRKKIACPWVPCTGSGRGAIQMSIQEASRVVREQRRGRRH